jgi:putative tryptophan/tyrosine transport system substrate-binding protein
MRRRDFIKGIAGSAVAWPLAARAQQPGKLSTIGLLGTTPSAWKSWVAAFVQRLGELGWIEGRTVAIEYRWAEGRRDKYSEITDEFVRLKVDVIVTAGSGAPTAKQITSSIPIVFVIANDPIGSGLVASLSRPGGNVTGFSIQAPDLAGKRLEVLREILPDLHVVAIMGNVGYSGAADEMGALETVARTLGMEVIPLAIRRAEDIAPAIESLNGRAGAFYACADALVVTNFKQIITSASAARLPTMNFTREFVEAGGLVSYGPDYTDLFRRTADYVDKILHGAKPADLPVQQPTKFELVINLKTAKALNLRVPSTLLSRADDVIE